MHKKQKEVVVEKKHKILSDEKINFIIYFLTNDF